MTPFEYFLEEQEKTAGFIGSPSTSATVARKGLDAMVQGLGAGLGAAALGAGAVAAQHIYNAATSSRDFRSMMSWNKDLHDQDQKHVLQAFKTLRRFSPDMSQDPLVSGSIIRNMVAMPENAANTMQTVMSTTSRLRHPVQEAFMQGSAMGVSKGMQELQPFGRAHSEHIRNEEAQLIKRKDEEQRKGQLEHARAMSEAAAAQREGAAAQRQLAEEMRAKREVARDPEAESRAWAQAIKGMPRTALHPFTVAAPETTPANIPFVGNPSGGPSANMQIYNVPDIHKTRRHNKRGR